MGQRTPGARRTYSEGYGGAVERENEAKEHATGKRSKERGAKYEGRLMVAASILPTLIQEYGAPEAARISVEYADALLQELTR